MHSTTYALRANLGEPKASLLPTECLAKCLSMMCFAVTNSLPNVGRHFEGEDVLGRSRCWSSSSSSRRWTKSLKFTSVINNTRRRSNFVLDSRAASCNCSQIKRTTHYHTRVWCWHQRELRDCGLLSPIYRRSLANLRHLQSRNKLKKIKHSFDSNPAIQKFFAWPFIITAAVIMHFMASSLIIMCRLPM